MIIGQATPRRGGWGIDDIVTFQVARADEDLAQTEHRVRVQPVPDGCGYLRQPCHGQVENRVGKHLGAGGKIPQPRFGTGMQCPDEVDGPCPPTGSVPCGILALESRLDGEFLRAEVSS